MDATTLARVAEPFFTTKPAGQGTGLGLAMAKGFVEQSGGIFAVESEPDRGTVVRLWFPAAGNVDG
jgi:signal transduction histidine kinase